MSEVTFKVGDLVYCPSISSEILTIKVLPIDVMVFDITHSISRNDCGFVSYLNNGAIIRLNNGFCMKTHCPKIIHATQQNYELLSKLYPNVEFEPPPKRKEPKEIIKAMLGSGKWYLVNYRGYGKIGNPPKNKTVTKEQFEKLDMNCYFDKNAYANVEVFCPKTGKTIIDFVDGEVILES